MRFIAQRDGRGRLITFSVASIALAVMSLVVAAPAHAVEPPVADANGPYTGTAVAAVSFSSAGSSDPDGTIVGYFWDFGDGSTSIAPNPTHIYAADNTYTVSLTVTDNDSAADTDTTAAEVTELGPGDLVVLVEPNGRWHLRSSDGTEQTFFYGVAGDVPLMGDWDGDGLDTPGMFRPSDGFAYLTNTLPPDNGAVVADPALTFFYGIAGDQVFVGDWDGDGMDTLGISRNGKMFLANANATVVADLEFWFGTPTDIAFGGDPDGDGKDSVFLYRPSSGFIYFTNSTPVGPADVAPTDGTLFFGVATDRFVVGDWDGDGTDTVGVFRPSDTTVYLRNTNTTGPPDASHVFGEAQWLPTAGTWS